MPSQIKYYPVGNGDQSLISVDEPGYRTDILVDCNIRVSSEGDTDPAKYDVKDDLLQTLKKKGVNDIKEVSYVDLFILTHGDKDHLLGFEKNFYQGDPSKYSKKNQENGEIFIDVLWFSPMVMGKEDNDDEKCFNKEAKRRIQLHRDKKAEKDLAGNRIVIIGYDANESLEGLDLVRKEPGDKVTKFNDRELATFSIFIHAPYKKQLTASDPNKNHTSVVFQARFKEKSDSKEFCTLAMFGGDADHHAWAIILEKTKKFGKDKSEQALDWDLFMACHHCSWTFFNDTSEEDNPDPVKTSLEVLDYKRKGARVIASSKEIIAKEKNPPSAKAKNEYVKKLEAESKFLNTAIEPNSDEPKPIVFEITATGPVKVKSSVVKGALTSAGGAGAAANIVKQG